MKNTSRWLLAAALSVIVGGSVAGWLSDDSARVAMAQAPAAPTPCTGQAAWVTHPAAPNFNADPNSLCAFYQYAWQSFLWLTSPASPGGPRVFETFPSVDDVFGTTSGTTGRAFAAVDPRLNRRRVFHERKGKPVRGRLSAGQPIDERTQALSNAILVDQQKIVTYYEELLDPKFEVPFIQACTLTVADCLGQPGASPLRFPPGSLELKVAWRPMWKTDPTARSFYTITVPGLQVENAAGKLVTPDFMALVGFHLVYTTPGHPEMVWTTFEHVANAPNGPCPGTSTCRQVPAGFKNWSFSDCKTTSCANVNNWPYPQSPAPTPTPPWPVAQAFRNYSFGTNPSLVDAAGNKGTTNVAVIQQLNKSMLGFMPPGSPFRNYFLNGAVWTLGTLPAVDPFSYSNGQPNPNLNEVGSTLLANSTMETFTQYPNPVPSPFKFSIESCFTCHNIGSGQGAFNVSHAFMAASSTGSCSWQQTPPAACLQTQPATAKAGR
jgi:hypothetical protein